MKRTLKFSLNLVNTNKVQILKDLFEEYKKSVNYYLKILSLSNKYILSQEEINSFNSPLSYRYKQCAGKQAIKILDTDINTSLNILNLYLAQQPMIAGSIKPQGQYLAIK